MTSCSLMKFLDHTKAWTDGSAGLLLASNHINGTPDVKLARRRLAVMGLVECQARVLLAAFF